MLTVYFDDFKLVGPARSLEEGWALITSQLDFEKRGDQVCI